MRIDPDKRTALAQRAVGRAAGCDISASAVRRRSAGSGGARTAGARHRRVAEAGVGSAVRSLVLVAPSLDLLGGQGIQARALADNLCADGISVTLLPINPSFPRGLRWLRRVRYLRTILNQVLYLSSLPVLRKADVVHVFCASYFSFLLGPAPALLAAKLSGKRIILNYHSGEAEDHLSRWGVFVHPWLRLADEIVVPSKYLQGVFARFGYQVQVIANVIDVSRFMYRDRMRIAPRFLSVRNLEPHYGVDVILHAFARIQRKYPQATLVVAGDGSRRAALEHLAEALELHGVRFIGSYAPGEAPRLFDDADILLNASLIDNQPVSLLEAFASGLPVVSTPTGDIGAMLQAGEAGTLVAPNDSDALAMAALALLDNPIRARRLARCARASLEQFTWANVRDGWVSAYRWGRT